MSFIGLARVSASKMSTTTFALASGSKATRFLRQNADQGRLYNSKWRPRGRHSEKIENGPVPQAPDQPSDARDFLLPSFDGTTEWNMIADETEAKRRPRDTKEAFQNRRSIRLNTFISCHVAGIHRLGRDNRVARRDARLRLREETEEDGSSRPESSKTHSFTSIKGTSSHLRRDRLENTSSAHDTVRHGTDHWKGGLRENVIAQSDSYDWDHSSSPSDSPDEAHSSWGGSSLDSVDDID